MGRYCSEVKTAEHIVRYANGFANGLQAIADGAH
jgi:hypothetical protein